jgi:hypothetical protein
MACAISSSPVLLCGLIHRLSITRARCTFPKRQWHHRRRRPRPSHRRRGAVGRGLPSLTLTGLPGAGVQGTPGRSFLPLVPGRYAKLADRLAAASFPWTPLGKSAGGSGFLAPPLREHARQPTERIERDRCDEPLQGSHQDLLVDDLAHEPEDDAEQSQDRPDQMITPSRPATHLPRAPTSGSGGGADRDDRVRARTLVDGAGTRAGRKEVRPIARLVRRAEPAQRVSRSIPTSTARSVRSSSNRSAVRRRRGSLGSPRTRRSGRRGRSRAASGRGAGVPQSGGLDPPRVPSPIPEGVALRPP